MTKTTRWQVIKISSLYKTSKTIIKKCILTPYEDFHLGYISKYSTTLLNLSYKGILKICFSGDVIKTAFVIFQ